MFNISIAATVHESDVNFTRNSFNGSGCTLKVQLLGRLLLESLLSGICISGIFSTQECVGMLENITRGNWHSQGSGLSFYLRRALVDPSGTLPSTDRATGL